MNQPFLISFILCVCQVYNVCADIVCEKSNIFSDIDHSVNFSPIISVDIPEPATVFLLVVGGLIVINKGRFFSSFFFHKH